MPDAGQTARVSVAVATLWADPGRVRPVDTPAVDHPPRLDDWVAGMSLADRDDLDGRTLSQLLLGEPVLVEEVRDGWARVVALAQPAGKLDDRGYPGWVPRCQLAEPDPAQGAGGDGVLIVDAGATTLRTSPGGAVAVAGVALGTRLDPARPDSAATVSEDWLPVTVPGRSGWLWAARADLAPAPRAVGAGRPLSELLGHAGRLLDVAYVWGGLSAAGIDCSGLVHLAARRLGITLPRDAGDQALATEPVPLGQELPGDLYFFGRDGRTPHHVGVVSAPPDPVTGTRRMLHACGTHRRVLVEELTGDRAATLVSAHRVG